MTQLKLYRLPETLRKVFKKPFGTIYKSTAALHEKVHEILEKRLFLVVVGDISLRTVQSFSVTPHIAVIDFKAERSPLPPYTPQAFDHASRVYNPPGYISEEALKALFQAVKALPATTCLIVEGEEDLLALPLFFLLPRGSYVIYGQPKEGAVVVEVTDQLANEAKRLFSLFEVVEG